MKKSTKFLLMMGLVGFTAPAFAQKTCNLGIVVTAAPSTLNYGDTAKLTVKITNNGTASLNTSDTIYFGQVGSATVFDVVPTGTIASGASQTFTDVLQFPHRFDTLTADRTLNFCLVLHDQATITKGGVPVPVTYNDPIATNDTSCLTITVKKKPTTGIFEFANKGQQLSIYPNPATTNIGFDINLDKAENVTVFVKDISGRDVMSKNFGTITAGKLNQFNLDISKLQAGMYFVEVNGEQKIATGKFVIK